MIRKRVDPLFNDFIVSIGGEKRECIGLKGMYSSELNLIAASPSISKPLPDLPNRHKFTGAWFLEESDYETPPVLQEFLDQGSPPIIISFGSMGGNKNVRDHKDSRRSGAAVRVNAQSFRRAGEILGWIAHLKTSVLSNMSPTTFSFVKDVVLSTTAGRARPLQRAGPACPPSLFHTLSGSTVLGTDPTQNRRCTQTSPIARA